MYSVSLHTINIHYTLQRTVQDMTTELGLAACFGKTDYKSVAKAFEECDYKDVEAWGKKYVGETIQKKRRRILKPQKPEDLGSKLTRFIEEKIMVA